MMREKQALSDWGKGEACTGHYDSLALGTVASGTGNCGSLALGTVALWHWALWISGTGHCGSLALGTMALCPCTAEFSALTP